MATPIIMPRQGQSVESCIITKWNKNKGDKVNVGDVLFTYETDKAAFEEEAKVEGTLLDIFFAEGDDVPVLTTVCVIGNEGESTAEFDPRAKADEDEIPEDKKEPQEAEDKKAQEDTAEQTQQVGTKSAYDGGRIKISPRAKNIAEKAGIDYRNVQGSGPDGRIIEKDILALYEKGPRMTSSAKEEYMKAGIQEVVGTGLGGRITTEDLKIAKAQEGSVMGQAAGVQQPDYVDVELTNIRKVIAKAMHHSLSSTAQLTLNTSFDATQILEYRKKIKESKDKLGLSNITINDIILFAVSRTLIKHKNLNAYFLDDKMRVFNNVHLGNAVDTERGLMVPTIFNANLKSLNEISKEVKELAEACQKGTINPDLLTGGSFTVTNLGMLGIESFTPVLNPPQVGILGVNTIVQRVKEIGGEYVYYPSMALSLTFDHRAVDGAPAARFLQDLKTNLENFSVLLAM